MQISDIQVQKKNPSRYNLFVEGQFYAGISVNTLSKFNLYKGLSIHEAQLENIVREDTLERFYLRAVEYLGRGIKSEKGIVDYLKKLYFKKRGDWFKEEGYIQCDQIELYVVNRLKQFGFLDDLLYAKTFVQHRINSKPKSPFALKLELKSKGISSEIADSVIESLEIDELELAKKAYFKKYKGAPFLSDESKKVNYLRGKGFSWELISQLFTENE